MSFFLGNMVGKTLSNVKSKIKYAKTQYKHFEFEKHIKKESINFKTPDYIKKNPFYWMELLRAKLGKAWQFLFENFKNGPKRIAFDDVKNLPSLANKVNHLATYSKQAAVMVLDSINSIVLKVTFGYLDVRKVMQGGLSPVMRNFSMTIGRNLNYQNLLIIYTKMGNSLNNYNRQAMGYLSKYRDPKAYQEFRSQYDKYLKKMSDQVKDRTQNGTKFERFIYKFTPSSLYNLKAMTNNKIHKINKYIKSPWYKQKMYNYENKFRKFWESKDKSSYFKYSYYRENVNSKNLSRFAENFSYSNARNFFAGGMKRKMRKIIFYIIGTFVFFYTLKYFIYSLFNRSSDKNLQQALNAVNELKIQNQELMKYNRDLIDKIMETKNK
jgi:hypothetical protein